MRSRAPRPPSGQGSSAAEMDIRLVDQAAALGAALLLGAALGLVYDILRPVRRAAPGALAAAFDALFCLIAGWAAFCFAMAAGDGRLGTWELCAAALGFAAYMHVLSTHTLRATEKMWRAAREGWARGEKFIKKTAVSAKLVFQKTVECFIIRK